MNIIRAVLLVSGLVFVATASADSRQDEQRAAIIAKLKTIRVPKEQFNSVSISEAVEYFQLKSRELDSTKKGVNIIAKLPEGSEAVTFSMDLTDVPLESALKYAVELSGLTMRVEPHAVVVTSITDNNERMFTRVYNVPPNFLQAVGSTK